MDTTKEILDTAYKTKLFIDKKSQEIDLKDLAKRLKSYITLEDAPDVGDLAESCEWAGKVIEALDEKLMDNSEDWALCGLNKESLLAQSLAITHENIKLKERLIEKEDQYDKDWYNLVAAKDTLKEELNKLKNGTK